MEPFDLHKLRGLIDAARRHAEQRAEREEQGMRIYLVRNAALGGGQGVAVRSLMEGPPPVEAGGELHEYVAAPPAFTEAQARFLNVYTEELRADVTAKPDAYAWPVEEAFSVAKRMVRALARGSGNKDSNAIRRTCKRLGVAYTYAGIREALGVAS